MRKLVVALLFGLLIGITTSPISSANTGGHGCAPSVPPGIAGSPAPVPATSGIIDINEVLLVPHSTWNCSETGAYFTITDTWVELYNTQSQPFNLYAAHAVLDSGPYTNAFYFPFGASIAAHGFLVLFPRTSASFVATETATLRLVINGMAVDQVTVPQLGPDQSYARTSDGASTWQITSAPTIDASNTSPQVTPTPTTAATSIKGYSGSSGNTRGGISSGTGSSTYNGNYKKILANGVQPQWHNLQLPTVTSTAISNITPTTLSLPSPSATAGLDLPQRIALTLLVIVLALTLFWCWRIFFKRP
ncbi:MAG: hypothetical protein NVS4B7_10470 [Ktedonobacteraceae bacterium]